MGKPVAHPCENGRFRSGIELPRWYSNGLLPSGVIAIEYGNRKSSENPLSMDCDLARKIIKRLPEGSPYFQQAMLPEGDP